MNREWTNIDKVIENYALISFLYIWYRNDFEPLIASWISSIFYNVVFIIEVVSAWYNLNHFFIHGLALCLNDS